MPNMGKKGVDQGNMSPVVESYQKPDSSYSQNQPGMTTQYISRKDSQENREASGIKKQSYKGRYQ